MYSLIPVLSVFARILVAFSPAFFVPLAWTFVLDAQEQVLLWTACFGLTLASGLALMAATRNQRRELQPRDGFLLVNLVWLVLPAYAALPLMYTVPDISWFKAYFEAMSGLTATGATALSGLDALPVSVNVWRCLLNFLGGLGIMLLVVAVLPLQDVSISTSGDYERYFDEGGQRHHHLIDPATGCSPCGVHSVTILAPDGLTSEALSKTVFVLGTERGLALVNSLAEVDAVVVDAAGRLHASSGLLQGVPQASARSS